MTRIRNFVVTFCIVIVISSGQSIKEQWKSVEPAYYNIRQNQMSQQSLIKIFNYALNSIARIRDNSQDQTQSLTDKMLVMNEQNEQNLIEIDSLTKQIKELDAQYTEVKVKLDNIMDKRQTESLGKPTKFEKDETSDEGFTEFVVFMMFILSMIGTIVSICTNKQLKMLIGERVMSVVPESCKKDKSVNTELSVPDPLSSVIIFKDTPNNSNPNSRAQSPQAATGCENVMIYGDDDAKISEIPDTIR
eukprot:127152_1